MWKKIYNYILAIYMGIAVNYAMYRIILSFVYDGEHWYTPFKCMCIIVFFGLNILLAIAADYVVQRARKKGVNPIGYVLCCCLPMYIYGEVNFCLYQNDYIIGIDNEIGEKVLAELLTNVYKSLIINLQTTLVLVAMVTILIFKWIGLNKWKYIVTTSGIGCVVTGATVFCGYLFLLLGVLSLVSLSIVQGIMGIILLIVTILVVYFYVLFTELKIVSIVKNEHDTELDSENNEEKDKRAIERYNVLIVFYPLVIWLLLADFEGKYVLISNYTEWIYDAFFIGACIFATFILYFIAVNTGKKIYKKSEEKSI